MKPFTTLIAATAVGGTLDILSAIAFGAAAGMSASRVLQSVAAGPFGNAAFEGGMASAAIGLAVHFLLMAVMVASYIWALGRLPRLSPIVTGAGFGLVVYLVMYWVVLPLRWPTIHPVTDPASIARALFSHILCMGIPVALTVHFLKRGVLV